MGEGGGGGGGIKKLQNGWRSRAGEDCRHRKFLTMGGSLKGSWERGSHERRLGGKNTLRQILREVKGGVRKRKN